MNGSVFTDLLYDLSAHQGQWNGRNKIFAIYGKKRRFHLVYCSNYLPSNTICAQFSYEITKIKQDN
jgi:hypothetical protein